MHGATIKIVDKQFKFILSMPLPNRTELGREKTPSSFIFDDYI